MLEDWQSVFWIDNRFDYGEERNITVGRAVGKVLFVVTTQVQEDLTRIISVRRAEKHEEHWFYYGRP